MNNPNWHELDSKIATEVEAMKIIHDVPTIKRAIDLAESESARNREQNTLPPNVA